MYFLCPCYIEVGLTHITWPSSWKSIKTFSEVFFGIFNALYVISHINPTFYVLLSQLTVSLAIFCQLCLWSKPHPLIIVCSRGVPVLNVPEFTRKDHVYYQRSYYTPLNNGMASQWEIGRSTTPWDNKTEDYFSIDVHNYIIDKQCLEQWLLSNSHGN